MNLADGVWTNSEQKGGGPDYPSSRWKLIEPLLPDVRGKACLDVGCSSGFFSLKLKELGAAYVLGIDQGEQIRATRQAMFAAQTLGLDIDIKALSVYNLSSIGRTFDVVLFMGVFYHLRHPLLALEALRSVCSGTLVFQTITTPHSTGSYESCPPPDQVDAMLHSPMLDSHPSSLRFIEGALDGDPSCWFVPSPEAVFAMLRSSGFSPQRMIFPDESEIILTASVR